MKVAILGLGYVGTVTAAGLASQGHDVVGVDVDRRKVATINAGQSPVVEPGVDRMVAAGGLRRAAARHHRRRARRWSEPTSRSCASGTPSTPRGDTDLTYLVPGARGPAGRRWPSLHPAAHRASHSVVIRSTVPPGTGYSVVEPAFTAEPLPDGWSVGTAMCPEFLREGCGVEDFFSPPFVVAGHRRTRAPGRPARTCSTSSTSEVHHVDVATAEALKYACNAFHAVKVTFANEMGRVFSAVRRRLARRHASSSARTTSSTSRPPTCGPGSPSAARACPRTCGRCRAWPVRAASTCRC